MNWYIDVQSDESNAYLVDSTTARFSIQLNFPLYLPGVLEVALVEFNAREKAQSTMKTGEGLYIFSDICQ